IHPVLAALLGVLRLTVYSILVLVFLLPGFQNYTKYETHSRILLVFDVSDSMNHQDDLPRPGQDPKKRPTRQDNVVKLFHTPFSTRPGDPARTLMQRLHEKSHVVAYRFGGEADPE